MIRKKARHFGFTLIELLVVLAIFSVLLATLLPAVQAARDSSRRASCQNNLKQISLALLHHVSSHHRFPSGGWGHEWVGVPGRGSGQNQPGGWIYSLLPYLDQSDLHGLGTDATGAAADDAYTKRLETPISLFVCPNRRRAAAWDVADEFPNVKTPKPHGRVSRMARSDYAINGGSSHVFSWPGPTSLAEGDQSSYWSNSPGLNKLRLKEFSGVSHLRLGVDLFSITDGASNTYLVGEKSLDPQRYEDGRSPGDNDSMYAGYCTDLHRFAGTLAAGSSGPVVAPDPLLPPLRDGPETVQPPGFIRFGSVHHDGFFMAYCDGHVRLESYELDAEVHFRAGHRKDRGRAMAALSAK